MLRPTRLPVRSFGPPVAVPNELSQVILTANQSACTTSDVTSTAVDRIAAHVDIERRFRLDAAALPPSNPTTTPGKALWSISHDPGSASAGSGTTSLRHPHCEP